ncbi:putative nucleic acid-binding protein [Catenulispora sp. EB89]|uniref:hypothetical protein n=1 Tax=Catenulispora sp. EB89 TaxID=3156257 RepID=UPI0035127D1C
MPAEEREFPGAELASRWLTVDQVLGRHGGWGWAAVDSAGEYFAADAAAAGGQGADDGLPDGGGDSASGDRAGHDNGAGDGADGNGNGNGDGDGDRAGNGDGDGDRAGNGDGNGNGHRPAPEVSAANGAHLAPDVIAAIGERPGPDLVAVDADLASRWFSADRTLGAFAGCTVLLPFPAVAELATWPERLLWGHSRTEELCEWLDPGRTIPGDETVARIWGRIVVAAQRTGTTPAANAAWIAAGCLSYGLPLATLDKRRYQPFADRYGLQLI